MADDDFLGTEDATESDFLATAKTFKDGFVAGYQQTRYQFDSVKDSGKREEFPTGSVRDTQEGKGRYDLIPVGPLRRLAQHYENGAKKYGDRNWEKGQPSSRYYSSAMRHLTNYMAGDRSEDHLAAVAWNAFAMMFNEESNHSALDDITYPKKIE